MFNDEELKQYQNEFQKLNIKLSDEELKPVLEFMYSYSKIVYDTFNINNYSKRVEI
jgi:hypothetical protein